MPTAPRSASSPFVVRAEWREVRTKGKREGGGTKPTSRWENAPAVLGGPAALLAAAALEGACPC